MSRFVIKKAFVAASLGLAMFVTSPALALEGTDEIVVTCLAVSDDRLEVKGAYSTLPSIEVKGHPELNSGFDCMETWKFLKDEGFVKSAEAVAAGFSAAVNRVIEMDPDITSPGFTMDLPTTPTVPLAFVIRFECKDFGTCLKL